MYKRWEGSKRRRSLRYWLGRLARAKLWQLALIAILLVFVSATFLRLNNLGMIGLREKVNVADKAGEASSLRQSLTDLQRYASGHMNAYPGVIYLQESYNRDYSNAVAAAGTSHNPTSDVYQQASIACRAKFQGGVASFRNDYVACVAAAVSNLPAEQQQAVNLPNPQVYRYSFSSPLISLDLAGLGVALTAIVMAVIGIKITGVIGLRVILKRRKQVL